MVAADRTLIRTVHEDGVWRVRHATHPTGEGVEFIYEDDGSITARDIETDVASFGETKAEALRMLAEAIELHEGGGEPVTHEDFEAWGLEETEPGEKDLPEFMRCEVC